MIVTEGVVEGYSVRIIVIEGVDDSYRGCG